MDTKNTSCHALSPADASARFPDLPAAPAVPAATIPSPTLGEAIALLASATSIDAARRKAWTAAIGTLARLSDRSPGSLPASLPALLPLMAALTPMTTKRSSKTLANTKSLVKAALTQLGLHHRVRADGAPLAPEWDHLYQQLPDKRFRNGLSRFIHYANRQGVAPSQVDQALLDQFVADLMESGEVAYVTRRHRDTAVLWNRSVRLLPGWPATLLDEPTVDRAKKHLLWDAFTPELQHDIERYLHWLGGADFLAEDAPPKGCKASTLKVRREQLRIAASSLVASGVSVSEISGLRCLVDPVMTKALLAEMVAVNADVKSTYIRGVATSLVALAKWCKVEPKALDEIKRLRSKLGSVQNGLTNKNRTLLRAFEDERILQALLGLPAKLAAQARRSRLSPERRVQRMQIALFLDLLLSIPLRIQNLSQLEVGRQLIRTAGPNEPMQLVLNADEVKNDQSMVFNVPVGVQALLDEYWQHFRPLLEPGNSDFLFIARGGVPKSSGSLRDGITKAVKRHIGIHMTPHQFRHLAAKLILDANPGAYPVVQYLLGHKNFKTTFAFYAESQSRNAGRVYDKLLTELRANSGDA
jgi:integrase